MGQFNSCHDSRFKPEKLLRFNSYESEWMQLHKPTWISNSAVIIHTELLGIIDDYWVDYQFADKSLQTNCHRLKILNRNGRIIKIIAVQLTESEKLINQNLVIDTREKQLKILVNDGKIILEIDAVRYYCVKDNRFSDYAFDNVLIQRPKSVSNHATFVDKQNPYSGKNYFEWVEIHKMNSDSNLYAIRTFNKNGIIIREDYCSLPNNTKINWDNYSFHSSFKAVSGIITNDGNVIKSAKFHYKYFGGWEMDRYLVSPSNKLTPVDFKNSHFGARFCILFDSIYFVGFNIGSSTKCIVKNGEITNIIEDIDVESIEETFIENHSSLDYNATYINLNFSDTAKDNLQVFNTLFTKMKTRDGFEYDFMLLKKGTEERLICKYEGTYISMGRTIHLNTYDGDDTSVIANPK